MELVIVTGLSGAGKSQAANALEDIGYFCIDNMPPSLMVPFVDMASKLEQYSHVAIVTDVRAGELFSGFFDALEEIKSRGIACRVLFLDAEDKALENRYRASRRNHPLMNGTVSLQQAMSDERRLLGPIRQMADYKVDTTYFSIAQLKDSIASLFLSDSKGAMSVRCLSFGFKYGLPSEADFVMDVRSLPNPFYVESLKELTGLDEQVRNYVFDSEDTAALLEKLYALIDCLLPLSRKEGKSQLVIAIGCTGGKHRSVAIASDLCGHIAAQGFNCISVHRDITKG